MTKPRSGWIYESAVSGAQASHFLVISEDLWNDRMPDSVVVPIYEAEMNPTVLVVETQENHYALCTRVRSLDQRLLGTAVGRCSNEPWVRTRLGVRRFLDIDQRLAGSACKEPASPRDDWWPRQHDIHFAVNPAIPGTDKLYAIVADNDWNSWEQTRYTAAVRITSKTKDSRKRWEVPVSTSWVVAGDIYSIHYRRFDQSVPDGAKYPQQLTTDEGAALAGKQKIALQL